MIWICYWKMELIGFIGGGFIDDVGVFDDVDNSLNRLPDLVPDVLSCVECTKSVGHPTYTTIHFSLMMTMMKRI